MERASRFIWEMSGGGKDRKLFRRAIKTLQKVIRETEDLALITDGERRDGNLLFEVCHELLKSGKGGRPRKTLGKGVQARLKNKGARKHQKGRERPRYEAPIPEHPETQQTLENRQTQANRLEAFNASLRRKSSAYRGKPNTYAKNTKRLQQRLDTHWIPHNFARVHFTTKQAPAVSIGIAPQPLTFKDLFAIRYVSN